MTGAAIDVRDDHAAALIGGIGQVRRGSPRDRARRTRRRRYLRPFGRVLATEA